MTEQLERQETFNVYAMQNMIIRENIETRIHMHIASAAQNLIEVGRCLNEAKQRGLVPHGEWEDWVRQHTGLHILKAQRLMKVAREVPEGSMMEKLPITKISAILALPEAEREGMAEKAVSENLSVRKLQEEVERERKRSEQLMEKHNEAVAARRELQGKYNRVHDEMEAAGKQAQATIDDLKRQLRAATDVLNRRNDGISPKAQAEIDRLKAALEDAEAYAAEQAKLRQAAQQAALNEAMSARDSAAAAPEYSAEDLAAAIRMFLGSAGALPHMGYEISRMSQRERSMIRAQVDMVIAWCDGCLTALNTHPGTFVEVQ